jgi:hypothetical protein
LERTAKGRRYLNLFTYGCKLLDASIEDLNCLGMLSSENVQIAGGSVDSCTAEEVARVFGRPACHFGESLSARKVFASYAIHSVSDSNDDLAVAQLCSMFDELFSRRNALRCQELVYQFE